MLAVLLISLLAAGPAGRPAILFDAAHAQTAGNADWTLDEDSCGIAQRFPTPDQRTITSSTPETFWSGAHSAMGIDLVKKGFQVESLPRGGRITFGDRRNPQDLVNYRILVLPEPNTRYSSAEIAAIHAFVNSGGGLLLISDHAGADRNNDGWDPTEILNELAIPFGITFNTRSGDRRLGWFNDRHNGNFTRDTASPIVRGRWGTASPRRGLGLVGSTSMTLSGNARGHVWRSGVPADRPAGVTYATSTYGKGRVAAIGDSSVTEDATNGCRHKTYPGYESRGNDNGLLVANGISWLAGQ